MTKQLPDDARKMMATCFINVGRQCSENTGMTLRESTEAAVNLFRHGLLVFEANDDTQEISCRLTVTEPRKPGRAVMRTLPDVEREIELQLRRAHH